MLLRQLQHTRGKNVIFVGMIHRSDADLSGAIVGQKDNLTAEVTTDEIISVRRSEIAHVITQGAARGSCRVTEAGRARPMKLWLMHNDEGVQGLVSKAMPGIQWQEWLSEQAKETGAIKLLANRIVQHLQALPEGTDKVSTQKLKEALGLEAPKQTFTWAAKEAEKRVSGWQIVGRSFVRK